MHISSDEHILVEHHGSSGIIRLNRPRALNSLTIGMVRAISSALDAFELDPGIAIVVVVGEGERSFCAGGDIRALYESGRAASPDAETFWREEFALVYRVARYPKPYIALMDGITMGGGVGISTHGRHRVVTERTRLAMPETGIGYFPDVGASWFLPRMPGETGTWIGLTGLDINADDAIFTGFADVKVESRLLPEILDRLANLPLGSGSGTCDALLKEYSVDPLRGPVQEGRNLIDRVFAFDNVEEIFAALAKEDDSFGENTIRALSSRSPKSLKVTLRLLREGAVSGSLFDCLDRELFACKQILKEPDFYEGVRAAVIDKDRRPKWHPETIDGVTADMVAAFFRSSTIGKE
ncbi:enoyl-CoA hydratase/isomerase family protein [Rhizobium lusitanum]|uniref:enoyl-CoA hydratase/isomerase family protein n=1 Tax=Rhizobium lusitanum TaxID=293958 RepID=UPI0019583389|nr:enoyl-CoA hydratase/isomerase family protein [Rhizobium lusitanum]MBM7045583.1 enoyl-CoA hydratase/isomerase family protein [Rhizobium lusitanum]